MHRSTWVLLIAQDRKLVTSWCWERKWGQSRWTSCRRQHSDVEHKNKGSDLRPSGWRPGWWPLSGTEIERKLGAGGLHIQSLRRVKTGELMWRQEVRRIIFAWVHVHLHFLLQIQKLSGISFLFPHPQCSPCWTAGQYSRFFLTHFIIKMFK